MTKHLGCWLLIVSWGTACGGSTDFSELPAGAGKSSGGTAVGGAQQAGSNSGGSSAGGNGGAGSSTGGSAAGGSTAGGSSSAGTTAGGSGSGGSSGGKAGAAGEAGANQGGTGGKAMVDPRCPARLPAGTCTKEQDEALCEYDSSDCLCHPSGQTVGICMRVDPTCPNEAAGGGPPSEASGGSSAKIALPTKRLCRCSGGSWQCSP